MGGGLVMMQVPVIPNSPLSHPSDEQTFGPMLLRNNQHSGLIENGAFDASIISYDREYHNSQGFSEVFKRHLGNVISILDRHFKPGAKLVEVGCGKGEFLTLIQQTGRYSISGYDASYEGNNPSIQARYLTDDDRIDADGVILRHVLEHVQRPHVFLNTLHRIFGSCPIYIEVPRAEWIFDNGAFFDVTYEHVNYFSQQSLACLFADQVTAHDSVFGNQYQYLIANLGNLSLEFAESYQSASAWSNLDFDKLFPTILDKIVEIEESLHPEGSVYLWGGATKGCMFLHHCTRLQRLKGRFKMVVDINPAKSGRFMPGSLMPIGMPEQLYQQARAHDTIVIANPNYSDEVKDALRKHAPMGIKVLVL